MSVSIYSLIMAIAWFSIAVLIGDLLLQKSERNRLAFIIAIFILALLRIFLPIELNGSIIIRSKTIYPMLQDIVRKQVLGPMTLGILLVVLWLSGTALSLAKLLRQMYLQRMFCQRAGRDSAENRATFEELCCEFGYHRQLKVLFSPYATTAYQAGFFYPCVIFPQSTELSEKELCYIFRHELCHFLGRDLWIKVGIQAVSAFLWWNPVVIVFKRSIEQFLELRCDRRACKNLTDIECHEYLKTLLKLVKEAPAATSGLSMGYFGRSEDMALIQRFRLIIESTRPGTGSKIRLCICCVICVILFIGSYFLTVQPWRPALQNEVPATAMDSSSSYIVRESDGTLSFYCNDVYTFQIPEDYLEIAPFSELQIYERTKEK